jgi:hypothetical protein
MNYDLATEEWGRSELLVTKKVHPIEWETKVEFKATKIVLKVGKEVGTARTPSP